MKYESLALDLVEFSRELFPGLEFIPLHAPQFSSEEERLLVDTVRSTFVSTVGQRVGEFERLIENFTSAKYAVAMNSGTAALHIALLVSGVSENDEVLTQPVTFVATGNAIRYCGADPVFLDIEKATLGLSPDSLEQFLAEHAELRRDGKCWNVRTGRRIMACVPVNSLGHPARIQEIRQICDRYHVKVVEDSAESLGSWIREAHTGLGGDAGILSFNGNKIITTGGGGAIITNNQELASRARHISSTAKKAHNWEFFHDCVGFNYRLPNINAALGCAQMGRISSFLEQKRCNARRYALWAMNHGVESVSEPKDAFSNFWLNAVLLPDRKARDTVLEVTNNNGVMTRPLWTPLNFLPMYKTCLSMDLPVSVDIFNRLVCLPSSASKS